MTSTTVGDSGCLDPPVPGALLSSLQVFSVFIHQLSLLLSPPGLSFASAWWLQLLSWTSRLSCRSKKLRLESGLLLFRSILLLALLAHRLSFSSSVPRPRPEPLSCSSSPRDGASLSRLRGLSAGAIGPPDGTSLSLARRRILFLFSFFSCDGTSSSSLTAPRPQCPSLSLPLRATAHLFLGCEASQCRRHRPS